MDGLAIMQVSGAVLPLMYVLRWAGVSRRWAPLLVPLVSALAVGLWANAHGPVSQADTFGYVTGWIAVVTTAATAWGFNWTAAESRGSRKQVRAATKPSTASTRSKGPVRSMADSWLAVVAWTRRRIVRQVSAPETRSGSPQPPAQPVCADVQNCRGFVVR
jgi:hypothetical protein